MKKVLFVLMFVCMVSLARADLVITNGTFDGGSSGALDVPDWYDLNTPDRGTAFWQTASICTTGVNPFDDDACMLGDAFPSGDADSWIYQAIGTKASCQSYSISIDYAQPTDGNTNRSPWIKVDIYQGSFPGAADDVDIAGQGLTLIDSVSSDSFPDLDIHNFTSPLDLSSANTTDMLWIRIANLPGQGSDAGSWAVIDNVQITSESAPCGSAYNPNPEDGEIDVVHNVITSWIPGESVNTHNIFLGTDLNDVNNATVSDPLGTITSIGQAAVVNTFDPGPLEFGTTYYWRVDEVNAPSSPGEYKGPIWSFTVEPYALKIPAENITATASSQSSANEGPEKTIDGSGLDPNGLHSTDIKAMWLSAGSDPGSAWIQYEFNKPYKLHEMLIWNYNGNGILYLYGIQYPTVEYSLDGADWTQVDVSELAPAPGEDDYAANTTIALNGAAAKYVRITANNNFGGGVGFFNKFGLSEVKFMYIPVSARNPVPENKATVVAIDTSLSWRSGREAAEHQVYLSTDQQAVTDGTASASTVNQSSYSPSTALNLGNTYYWRVDEVNNAEATTTWPSDIWSFTTEDYIVVDDFESYNDIPEGQDGSHLVYVIWQDGYLNPSVNGSTIGYPSGLSMETGNVHGGDQAVPLLYNNTTATKSEVTIDPGQLPIGRNWSKGSPHALVLWIYGDPTNATSDQLYVKIGSAKAVFDGNISRPVWMQWIIDLAAIGASLNNVSSFAIGLERTGGSGGTGTILIDDIRLYGVAPVPAEIFIEAEAYDSIQAPMLVYDDPNASGGKYVMKDPAAATSTGNPPADGLVTYSFTVTGGTYTLAGRVLTVGTGDAFWLRIPGATTQTTNHTSGWIQWNGITVEGDWGWEQVWSSNDAGTVVEFTMPAGTYTLELKYRDNTSQIDAWLLTKID
jgi:hypothetical protein